ncbi:MAG: DUF1127 domain-containing protein [Rhodospirillales bacterium]|nr:DUF1127 domain-containing protein [Rhodospirillales bacterium]
MKSPALCCPPLASASPLVTTRSLLRAVLDRIAHWHQNARGRAQLAAMDARMLKDIGLSRSEAWLEANTPFWKDAAPAPDRRPPYPTDLRGSTDLPARKLR